MENEQLSIFDESMRYLGTRTRAEVHAQGFWHETFHCWFVQDNGAQRSLLFQLRSARKSIFPNKLDVTAAGHLLTGETPLDGIREVQEELGFAPPFAALHSLGIIPVTVTLPNVIDKEFCHVYLYRFSGTLLDLTLQEDEVAGIFHIEILPFLQLLHGEIMSIPGTGLLVQSGQPISTARTFTLQDFCAHQDHAYYMALCSAALAL